jgi:hypothetical protein
MAAMENYAAIKQRLVAAARVTQSLVWTIRCRRSMADALERDAGKSSDPHQRGAQQLGEGVFADGSADLAWRASGAAETKLFDLVGRCEP